MPTPFLLTGVTGGLGAKILSDMLNVHHISPQSIIATSSSPSKRSHFEDMGLQFRVADYKDPDTLASAFADVETLLFMASSEWDTPTRIQDHGNVISAAKKAGVKRVWYVSLAFGGFGEGSQIFFQQAHYATEDLLRDSGLEILSLRAGVYADAFPLFLNWYPSSKEVLLPKVQPGLQEGKVAWTSREELGEAIAALLAKGMHAFPSIKPKGEKNIVLLTAAKTESLIDLVQAINKACSTSIPVEFLEPEKWTDACARDDQGGKPKAVFEAMMVFTNGICGGDASTTDPAMETLLGRKPETGTQRVERLLKADSGYTWHQNYAR